MLNQFYMVPAGLSIGSKGHLVAAKVKGYRRQGEMPRVTASSRSIARPASRGKSNGRSADATAIGGNA
jgi:hypothetical protein